MSEILLVGNIDNTIITITPTADVVVPIDIHSADSSSETILAQSTKTIKLHRFQTFFFGATGVDLSDTCIVSNQPLESLLCILLLLEVWISSTLIAPPIAILNLTNHC